jgi:hypothetical protein
MNEPVMTQAEIARQATKLRAYRKGFADGIEAAAKARAVLREIDAAIDVEISDARGANPTRFSLTVNKIMSKVDRALLVEPGETKT